MIAVAFITLGAVATVVAVALLGQLIRFVCTFLGVIAEPSDRPPRIDP